MEKPWEERITTVTLVRSSTLPPFYGYLNISTVNCSQISNIEAHIFPPAFWESPGRSQQYCRHDKTYYLMLGAPLVQKGWLLAQIQAVQRVFSGCTQTQICAFMGKREWKEHPLNLPLFHCSPRSFQGFWLYLGRRGQTAEPTLCSQCGGWYNLMVSFWRESHCRSQAALAEELWRNWI